MIKNILLIITLLLCGQVFAQGIGSDIPTTEGPDKGPDLGGDILGPNSKPCADCCRDAGDSEAGQKNCGDLLTGCVCRTLPEPECFSRSAMAHAGWSATDISETTNQVLGFWKMFSEIDRLKVVTSAYEENRMNFVKLIMADEALSKQTSVFLSNNRSVLLKIVSGKGAVRENEFRDLRKYLGAVANSGKASKNRAAKIVRTVILPRLNDAMVGMTYKAAMVCFAEYSCGKN